MKKLKIINHQGEVEKEFDVYVEGQDFSWQSPQPIPIWLGSIVLVEVGSTQEVIGKVEPVEQVIEALDRFSEGEEVNISLKLKEPEGVSEEAQEFINESTELHDSSAGDSRSGETVEPESVAPVHKKSTRRKSTKRNK